MNLQQISQPRSANGFGHRKVEKETGNRVDNKSETEKTNHSRLTTAGVLSGDKGGGNESPSRERLVYLTTCLIGHHVEVQVIDGSVFSGIFHATNAGKDFGIILKMACLTKAGSSRGQKNISDSVNKLPSKILIIPATELVQIMAKAVSVTRDGLANELQCEKQHEIMTDSSISQSRHVEVERELGRWVPDEDDPECPELDNIFDGPWNRGWDQFEANETLFGVKSTFNEDLYTTKLDRGPQMRELEREALRIAREIEGEDTQDLHLAEERGIQLHGHLEVDEETRFSSVLRGVNDSGYDEKENLLDSQNTETFGNVSDSVINKSYTGFVSGRSNDGAQVPSSSSSMDEVQSSRSIIGMDLYLSVSNNQARQLSSDRLPKSLLAFDGGSRIQENPFNEKVADYSKEESEKQTIAEETRASKSKDSQSSLRPKKASSDKGGLSPNATAYAPSSSTGHEKNIGSGLSENAVSVKPHGTTQSASSRMRPGSTMSSTSDCGNAVPASSVPGLSPSSSVGSPSSERSTLNPHAKEFKLNPNATSFIPTQTPLRPTSLVSDGSFYYPSNVTTVPHIHGMPVGLGNGPSFTGHQPVMINPQAATMQTPQAYFHSNGPQYGQQMLLGQPRQVMYMPTYPPEMQHKGREF